MIDIDNKILQSNLLSKMSFKNDRFDIKPADKSGISIMYYASSSIMLTYVTDELQNVTK